MRRLLYLAGGYLSLALGLLGTALPLLPTVPFVLLAAYCFARSSPALERRLTGHPRWGPHIKAWREQGAIRPAAKRTALVAFVASAGIGFLVLPWPLSAIPAVAALAGGTWVMTRPVP